MSDLEQSSFADLAPAQRRRGEYPLPEGARIERCRSCNTQIVWARTAGDRPIPLSLATIQVRDGVQWLLPHFVDCPEGEKWSRRL